MKKLIIAGAVSLSLAGCMSDSGGQAPTHRWASTSGAADEIQYRNDHARCQAQASIGEDQSQLDSAEPQGILKLISYALLAPNSHNIQPWLLKLTGENSFDLYVDQTRLLPKTDPPSRQIHISQGTFLEYLKIKKANHVEGCPSWLT